MKRHEHKATPRLRAILPWSEPMQNQSRRRISADQKHRVPTAGRTCRLDDPQASPQSGRPTTGPPLGNNPVLPLRRFAENQPPAPHPSRVQATAAKDKHRTASRRPPPAVAEAASARPRSPAGRRPHSVGRCRDNGRRGQASGAVAAQPTNLPAVTGGACGLPLDTLRRSPLILFPLSLLPRRSTHAGRPCRRPSIHPFSTSPLLGQSTCRSPVARGRRQPAFAPRPVPRILLGLRTKPPGRLANAFWLWRVWLLLPFRFARVPSRGVAAGSYDGPCGTAGQSRQRLARDSRLADWQSEIACPFFIHFVLWRWP